MLTKFHAKEKVVIDLFSCTCVKSSSKAIHTFANVSVLNMTGVNTCDKYKN